LIEQAAGMPFVAGSLASRDLLERLVALQSRAAAIFRANRMRTEAVLAERFAARARLMLDEPKAIRRMHALTEVLYDSPDVESLLERALEGAMSLIGGDFGNVQLRNLAKGGLRIASQCGFGREFREYFAIVEDDSSACGRAAQQRSQTVIADVNRDAVFAPHRAIAAASGFRAVQSTPLLDPAGRLLGVISTHYRRSHRPASQDLELMQWFGDHVGAALADQQNDPATVYQATAALHLGTADLHDAAAARMLESSRTLQSSGNGVAALAIQERAGLARSRAQQQRERARALAERVQRPR